MAEPDFAAEGLLDGLEPEDRAARRKLLGELYEQGVSLAELKRAVLQQRLAILPVELVLGGAQSFTPEELAEDIGVDVETLARQRAALGLPRPEPGEKVLTDADRDAALRGKAVREAGLDDVAALDLLRVMGEAGARVAESLREMVGETLVRPGDTELDLGHRYAAFARATAPQLGETLGYVANVHLRELLRDAAISDVERRRGELMPGAEDVSVAFADLVGFTRLGAEVPADELGQVAGRLAELAIARAEAPVRLVKTIGDAAMLVSAESAPLIEAALDLVDAADREGQDFPQLKAGVASGPALHRGGDWYGHTVNLASRVTSIARPASVLATREVHDAFPDAFRWSFAGERKLKGIGAEALFRARRREDGELPEEV